MTAPIGEPGAHCRACPSQRRNSIGAPDKPAARRFRHQWSIQPESVSAVFETKALTSAPTRHPVDWIAPPGSAVDTFRIPVRGWTQVGFSLAIQTGKGP